MREIEYRGWDEELKKWQYGYYYFYTDTIYCVASDKDHEANEHHCILFDGFCDWNMPRPHYKAFVKKETIGQYTGLRDKNGIKIYEGDMLEVVSSTIDGECNIWKTVIDSILDFDIMKHLCCANKLKVIGNIHERSEDNDK